MNKTAPALSASVAAVASLGAAADLARQIYMSALAANPNADLSQLYSKEMKAAALWSDAESKVLANDPAATKAKQALDSAVANARKDLDGLKGLTEALTAADKLLKLATTLSKFLM